MKSLRTLILALAVCGTSLAAQKAVPEKDAKATAAEKEEQELESTLAESGSSAIEYARALENHLKKYPQSARREEIVRVLARSGVDLRDKRRLLEYGVPAIEAGTQDPRILEHVSRALIDRDDKESLERAARYGARLGEIVTAELAQIRGDKEYKAGKGDRLNELEELQGRALLFRARSAGQLGKKDEALEFAQKAFAVYPGWEAAREIARWYERSGKPREALPYLALALTIDDTRANSEARAADRVRLNDLAEKANAKDELGGIVLSALDKSMALQAERKARIKAVDPNYGATQPVDFTLSSIDGTKLAISSLKGKVAVIDFWATWCGPCRAQYPLYERVKERFKNRPEVVFLAVSTDEDRSVVEPFLKAQKWNKNVYFEDGLSNVMRVNSIPTTLILGRSGEVYGRLNGYLPDRFVDMLSQRIDSALVETR